MLKTLGVFEGHFTKHCYLHQPGASGSARPSPQMTCRPLPVLFHDAFACIPCDRNVHDPTTLRDVSVLPQNITIVDNII